MGRAMELIGLRGEVPEAWPPAAQQHLSWDGQVYRKCSGCGAEFREIQELVGETSIGSACGTCHATARTFVLHLLRAEYRCGECDHTFTISSSGFEMPRCPRCRSRDLRAQQQEIAPPFPGEFTQELIGSHHWGRSAQDDAQLIMSELRGVSISYEFPRHLLVLTRFCRRLRLFGGYGTDADRDTIQNIEANLLRDYYRRTGELPAAVEALRLFEEGAATSDPRRRALEEHNVAMAVYSMLAREGEREVILATGRPSIRAEAVSAASRALAFFEERPDEESRTQAARIHHIAGDLLRVGESTEAEQRQSLEHLDAALKIRGIPSELRANIKTSRKATVALLPRGEERTLGGKVSKFLRNAVGRRAVGAGTAGAAGAADAGVGAGTPSAPRTPSRAADRAEKAGTQEPASVPFRNPGNIGVEIVPLEGDPEQIAEGLIRSSLPKSFLDEIDIASSEGQGRLLACLMLRRHQASLEKDEILRFVERNRTALEGGALDLVRMFINIATLTDGGAEMTTFFEYFTTQVQAALANRPQDIDIKSDRLLWLVYAAAQQLSGGRLTYAAARDLLAKPEHRERISPLSLRFMLVDYAESIGGTSEAPTEFVMLVNECALMSENVKAVVASVALLGKISTPADVQALIDLLQRSRTFLLAHQEPVEEADAAIARYQGRFAKSVSDDDF